jgi:uncharacterized protein (TIGR03437 family)
MRRFIAWIPVWLLVCGLCSAQIPVINANGVTNGASFQPGIAAGSWVTIKGTNLATTTRIWGSADFRGSTLPLSLDGTSVKINNRDAPVYFISPTQVNVLAPPDATVGNVPVTVSTSRGTSAPVNAALQRFAPGWFSFSQLNGAYPAAVHANGTLLGPSNLFGSAATAVPAQPNEKVLLFATGFAATTPAADPLTIFAGAAPLIAPNDLRITVNNQAVTIDFAGLVSNGLYQFNITVPNLADGEYNLVASIGGFSTQTLKLAVRTPPAPPVITKMSVTDFIWGQSSSVQLTGTGMTGVNRVEFSDSSKVRIVGSISATSTSVSFTLAVDGDATPGERTLAVANANGLSNTTTFQVRRGNPTLTGFLPAVVYQDRMYASEFLKTNSRGVLKLSGSDLQGGTSVDVSPGAGIRFLPSFASENVGGWMFVDAGAGTGIRQVTVTSPAGTSNAVSFEVQAAPPGAPVISDVKLNPPSTGNFNISYSGSLSFTDSDGDIKSGTGGAFLRLTMVSGLQGSPVQTVDLSGTFLEKTGLTSGTINISTSVSAVLALQANAAAQVAVTLFDSANRPSNTVIVDVTRWIIPIL